MARGKRIRGLTIEINGDTTGLDQALKKTNSTLNETQRELNDTNKLLKLDPTNTELLTQKQGQLKTAISNTTDKLNTLKEAQRQAKEQLANGDIGQAQYDALQREIIETRHELDKLETEAAKCASTMGVKMEEAGKRISTVGDTIAGVGDRLTAAVTVPIVGAATAAVAGFAEVDKTMQLTHATMGNTEEQAKLLEDAMEAAAAQSTFGMSDAATATLNFARAGLDAEQAAAALAPAMNLAAGEGGNLDTVSAGLVATINGFHGSFEDAGHYADVFANACNNSALDVDSLSSAMSVAAPIFAAAGYSVEDAALYMGVMANNGIEADKAANSLKTGLARLVKPAKEGAEMMEQLGISVTNSDGSMKDSITIQKELHDAFANLSESEQIAAASAIFGKNQMAPWLALINTAPEDVDELSGALGVVGTTGDMANAMMSGFAGSIEKLKSSLDVLRVQFGRLIAEAIQPAINWIQGIVDKLLAMDDEHKKLIIRIGAVVAAVGPVLSIGGRVMKFVIGPIISNIGRLLSVGKSLVTGMAHFKTAFSAIISPVGVAVAAIVGLVAIIKNLWDTNEAFRNRIIEIWTSIKANVSEFVDGIKERLAGFGIEFESIGDLLRGVWQKICDFFAPVIGGVFQEVEAIIRAALDTMMGIFDFFIAVFQGDWSGAWDALKGVFGAIWTGICDTFAICMDTLKGAANVVLGWFGTDWDTVWNGIKSFFDTTLPGAWGVMAGIFEGIGTWWTGTVMPAAGDFFSNTWEGLKIIFLEIIPNALGTMRGWFEALGSWWTGTAWPIVQPFLEGAWEGLKTFFLTTIPEALGTLRGWFEALGSWWEGTAWPVVQPFLEGAWNGLVTFFTETIPQKWEDTKKIFDGIATWWADIGAADFFGAAWEKIIGFFETGIPAAWEFVKGIFNGLASWWEGIKESDFFSTTWAVIAYFFEHAIPDAWAFITGIFDGLADWWSGILNGGAADFFGAAWEGISTAIGGIKTAWENFTSNFDISEWWEGVTSTAGDFISGTWETVKSGIDALPGAWEAVKTAFADIGDWWAGVKEAAGDFFNGIWNFFTGGGQSDEAAQNSANIWETASSDIQDAFSEMETAATTDFGTVNTVAQSKTAEVTEKIGAAWDGLKARMIGDIATIKNTMTSAWTDIDTQSTTKWGSVMKAIVEAIEAIKTSLTGNDGFTAKLSEMNTAATSQFNTLKSTVSSAMSEIQNTIANTQLNMPNIALPHIGWTWEWLDYGDGGGVNIPRFNVDWYAKAMQNGMILNNPTIFGMMNGRFLGGGEAGSEVVAGTGSLMNMIKEAVDSSANAVNIGTINIPIQTMDRVDAKSLARQIEPELAKIIIKRGAKF